MNISEEKKEPSRGRYGYETGNIRMLERTPRSFKPYTVSDRGASTMQQTQPLSYSTVSLPVLPFNNQYSKVLKPNSLEDKQPSKYSTFNCFFNRLYIMCKPILGITLALLQCVSMAFIYLMVSYVRKTDPKATVMNISMSSDQTSTTTPTSSIISSTIRNDKFDSKNNFTLPHNQQQIGVSPLFISNLRMIYQLLVVIPLTVYFKDPVLPPRKYAVPVLIRCVSGSLGVVSLMFAMSYAPISDASAIVYTSPIFVAILARIFLKERLSLLDSLLLLVTITGVIFITRPNALFKHILPMDQPAEMLDKRYPKHYLGLGFAFLSAFTSSVAIVSIRKVRSLPFSIILLDFAVVGIVVTTVLCVAFRGYASVIPCDTWDRPLLVTSSLLGCLSQFFLFGALKFENAGIISATASMGIVFTFILQIVFKGENPPWTSVLGASLVTFSITALGIKRWLASRRARIKKRKAILAAAAAAAAEEDDNREKTTEEYEGEKSQLLSKRRPFKVGRHPPLPEAAEEEEGEEKEYLIDVTGPNVMEKSASAGPETFFSLISNDLLPSSTDDTTSHTTLKTVGMKTPKSSICKEYSQPSSKTEPLIAATGIIAPKSSSVSINTVGNVNGTDLSQSKLVKSASMTTRKKRKSVTSSVKGIDLLIDTFGQYRSTDRLTTPTYNKGHGPDYNLATTNKSAAAGTQHFRYGRSLSATVAPNIAAVKAGGNAYLALPDERHANKNVPDIETDDDDVSDTSSIEYGTVTPAPD